MGKNMVKTDQAKSFTGLVVVLYLAFGLYAVAIGESTTEDNKRVFDSIWAATRIGDIKDIQEQLNEGMGVNVRNGKGNTPLHIAALLGQTEIMKILIQKGADVNASNNDGATPLHAAALFGQAEAAEILLQNGADINSRYSDGTVPLDLTHLDWGTTQAIASSLEIELDEEQVKAGRAKVASIIRQQIAKREINPETIIEQMIRESITAWNSQDIKGSVKNIHPTRYSAFSALPQGKLAFLPREFLIGLLERTLPVIGKTTISGPIDFNVWVHGDAAFATYLTIMKIGTEPLTIRNTEVYYRIDGVWQSVHSHQSVLKEQ